MGLFGKNKKEVKSANSPNAQLPELPKLPELPNMSNTPKSKNVSGQKLHQLPSIPSSSSMGNKFSQDSIKEAVSGKRGGEDYADDSDYERSSQMMREPPLRKPMIEELDEEIEAEELGVPTPRSNPRSRGRRQRVSMEEEPIFVRIDNFEEAMNIFDETTKKLSEIEHLLAKIKKVKDDEAKELQSWETNVKKLKREIEKVDKDIFSKI